MSFLDNILNGGYARGLKHSAGYIDGALASPPAEGQILTAIDADTMVWSDPPAGVTFGTTAGTATEGNDYRIGKLILTGFAEPPADDPIILLQGSALPTAGQILTAIDSGIIEFRDQPIQPLYLPAPASPNAFDDEFTSGSADLVARGWIIRNLSTNTNLTRVGDIVPYDYKWNSGGGTQLTPSQYRSRIQNGKLVLQLCQSSDHVYAIYKAVTLPTTTTVHGGVLWGIFSSPQANAGVSGNIAISFFGNNAGFPHLSTHLSREVGNGSTAFVGSVASPVGNFSESMGHASNMTLHGVALTAAPMTFAFDADPVNGSDFSSSGAPASTAYPGPAAVAYAGLRIRVPNSSPQQSSSNLYFVEALRLRTGDVKALCTSAQWLFA